MFNAKILIGDFKHTWNIWDREFQKYLVYNIIYGYIVCNDGHGYGVLKHLTSCLSVYALRFYCNLEVAYNKYYLKHTTTSNHKPTFVMARRDFIPNTIEKRVKEDSMEAWMWGQRLEDLLESCVVKDVI
jgi:hypothetical protein